MTLKILSYNIDTNLFRSEEGYAREAFPQWRANARRSLIIKTIAEIIDSDNSPDVIHIQEGRRCLTKFGEVVDSITDLVNFLTSKNYRVIIKPYHPLQDLSCQYITAYKITRLRQIEKEKTLYLTMTPMVLTPRPSTAARTKKEKNEIRQAIIDHNYGELWERCVLITNFIDRRTNEHITCINVHLGHGLEHRKQASKLISQFAKDIWNNNPDTKIVVTGDFNTFEDRGGEEQLAIIKEAEVLKEPIQLTLFDGTPVTSTFVAFPFDFAKDDKRLNMTVKLSKMPLAECRAAVIRTYDKECSSLGSILDRVFFAGFSNCKAYLDPRPLYADRPIQFNEEEVKAYVLRHVGITTTNYKDELKEQGLKRSSIGPAYASDHQPLIAILEY